MLHGRVGGGGALFGLIKTPHSLADITEAAMIEYGNFHNVLQWRVTMSSKRIPELASKKPTELCVGHLDKKWKLYAAV